MRRGRQLNADFWDIIRFRLNELEALHAGLHHLPVVFITEPDGSVSGRLEVAVNMPAPTQEPRSQEFITRAIGQALVCMALKAEGFIE